MELQAKTSNLIGTRELLLGYGVIPESVFAEVGIKPEWLQSGEQWFPYHLFISLLHHCAEVTGDPLVGIRLGNLQGIRQLGALGEIMLRSGTVFEALQELSRYFHTHSQGATVTLTTEGELAVLSFQILIPGYRGVPQEEDSAIAIGLLVMRLLCGKGWKPSGVHVSHSGYGITREYEAALGCPVLFNSGVSCLSFPRAVLERPVSSSDAELYAQLRSRLGYEKGSKPLDIATVVKKLILRCLLRGSPSIESVASLLFVDKRTLQRKLARHGLKYQLLLEETRFDIACKYLSGSDLSLTQIAELLCYSDLSSFSRAFKNNAQLSPKDWRQQTRVSATT